jgi:hypothetical protein
MTLLDCTSYAAATIMVFRLLGSNEGDPAFRSQQQSVELWHQEFGSSLFKEIGENELVYRHFY